VTETIRCPGCSTRFTLQPERVHAGLRRAKCFRCETVFDIVDVVARLLAVPEPPAPDPVEPSLFEAFDTPPPSLTLGDLEGAEDEIMEKTLVILPPPGAAEAVSEPVVFTPVPPAIPEPVAFLPEPPAVPGTVEFSPEGDPTSTGGFSSARDAISKLMGDAPSAQGADRRHLGSRNPMDVEATLTALDATLGGNPPTAAPAPAEATASTMKLTAQEIQAAMASVGSQPKPMSAAPPPAPRAEVPPPPRPAEAPVAPGADLLKIQIEQETLNNVTIDQVTAWIEQGRVQEYHMVARQYSDNWIEALKVPALRPVFERKRRDAGGSDAPYPAPEPARKSLFGGLFGRN